MYFPKGISDKVKKRYIGAGQSWEEIRFKGLFDNQFVIEKIEDLEKQGWKMESHNFALGKSASAAEADSSLRFEHEESEYISYFLFSRSD